MIANRPPAVDVELVRLEHEHAAQLLHNMPFGHLDGFSVGGCGFDGSEDALPCAGAVGVGCGGAHGSEEVGEANVFGPEIVRGAGGGHGALEFGRVEPHDEVVGRVLDGHGRLKGFEQVLLVDAVHALAPQVLLDLVVFGDHAHAEDHGEDDGDGALAVRATVLGDGVEEAVGGGVAALARGAEGAGDGTRHDEEVEGGFFEGVVQVDGTLHLGVGADFPALIGHRVEETILSRMLVEILTR